MWDTLGSAFFADPVNRWLYPDDAQYTSDFPRLLDSFGGAAFDLRTVWGLDNCAAVAVWFPPGAEIDGNAVSDVMTHTIATDKHEDVFAVLDQMASTHPTDPHWYLPWLGVHRSGQGHGLGGHLLTQCLQVVDADHLPAYLDSPNPRNVTLYQRHGFDIIRIAQAGECPPVTCMLRPAR